MFSVSSELGNRELCDLICESINGDLNSDVAVSHLLFRAGLELNCDKEITFIASHFHEFQLDTLLPLPLPLIHAILADPSLTLTSEDSLWKFIHTRVTDDSSSFYLLEFLSFESLSTEAFSECADVITMNFELINVHIWESLRKRLRLPVARRPRSGRVLDLSHACPFRTNAPLDGIIAYLTEKYDGNVHDKRVVEITARSVYRNDPKYAVKNVADLKTKNSYTSAQIPGQWICYDFKEHSVTLTHYSVRSFDGYSQCEHPKDWVLEGSLDGEWWVVLDRQNNSKALDGKERIGTFPISEPRELRMIRFRQTGPNHMGNEYLIISGFEVFGTILLDER
jgi:hypothetical protein